MTQRYSPNALQAAASTPFPREASLQKPVAADLGRKSPQPSATEKLKNLQTDVNELKRKEAELRSLLAEVTGTAADSLLARLGSISAQEVLNKDVYALVQELSVVQSARQFAQCLQELQGVLKHLERQLRAVERAANAGDLDTFLITVSEAIASHNTVGENCEKLAQLPASGLPQLFRQHANSGVSRATSDQEKLLSSLKRMLRNQLKQLGWPPPLAGPSSPAPGQSQGPHIAETSTSWQGFEAADQEAVDWVVRLMAAMVALQRSVQRSSFELGLTDPAGDPPALWAVEELTAPLAERLDHHFVGNPNTDRIDHPEWLFETIRRIAASLAPQLTLLAPTLTAHELQSVYHLPFEFVRALRTALQGILKRHTLPRLVTTAQPGLWLNFVEKAVVFERKLAPLQGIPAARPAGDDTAELWRRGSCIAAICSTQQFKDAWWEAEVDEAGRQLADALDAPSAWTPAHLAWAAPVADDWDEPTTGPEKRNSTAWQSEFWAPQVTEAVLSLVTQLAKKAAWLPDEAVRDYAQAVPQEVLRRLRKHMNSELKRLEEFREELSAEGAPKIGALLCGAHHLEHSLRESSGPLLLLETPGDDDLSMAGPSLLSIEADAFGAFKQRGALRLSKAVLDRFRQASAAYLRKSNIQAFGQAYSPDFREGVLSPGLRRGIEDLQIHLTQLSQVLDAVLFRDVWKGLAAALNRLLFNALITEASFSPQGAQQLATDVAGIMDVFLRFTNKPAAHFREITEAARLLSADESLAAEAARQLGSGPADHRAAALQPLGIVRLTPHQAAHVLAQRV